MQDHRRLRVWRDAQEICVDVYRFSADFPREELVTPRSSSMHTTVGWVQLKRFVNWSSRVQSEPEPRATVNR